MARKLTQDQFIERSNSVHGDKYNYAKTVYIKSSEKVTIICPAHGNFDQTANSHLKGHGCPKCYGRYQPTTNEFIDKAKKVHGDKYNYSLVEYNGAHSKVKIICPAHGEFKQKASSHLQENGCPKCNIESQKLSTKDFIEKSKAVHGDKYCYNRVEYVSYETKVTITCPIHGDFKQKPNNHFKGHGCAKCGYDYVSGFKRSKYINNCEKRHNGLSNIYLIKCFNKNECFYKVGITCRNISHRFSKSNMPYSYNVLSTLNLPSGQAWDSEQYIHKILTGFKYRPLIAFNGSIKECFSELTQEVKDFFGVK